MRMCVLLFAIAAACGTEAGSPPNNGATPTNNTTSDADTGPQTIADSCEEIGARFVDAVRALPRTCASDDDCQIVPRAQVCDCDLAVTASVATDDYDAARAELDAAQCANPFGCVTQSCPYRRLSTSGDLLPRCNAEKECEIVQVLSCANYEAAAIGGIVGPGGCTEADDCTVMAHLNPCGCPESITKNFPGLAHDAVEELIEINEARCDRGECAECPLTGTLQCVDNMCTM